MLFRSYMDRPGDDAENTGGWLFQDPASKAPRGAADWDSTEPYMPSKDYENSWLQIMDPSLSRPYKKCASK